jgi:hypothetical protein
VLLAGTVGLSLQVAAQVPDAAFTSALRLEPGISVKLAFEPTALVQVDIEGERVSAMPVLNESARTQLAIYSFVVREQDGKYKLFYPVVSLVDGSGAVVKTIKPRFEFRFAGAVLNNEFDLPAGATRLLVHTRKEFVESGFESSFGPEWQGMDTPVPPAAALGAAAVGAAFPVVGLVVGLSMLSIPKGTCTFGERGLIQLHAQ